MTIQIIGKYQSVTDAVKVASGLGLKGFKARSILIITNHNPLELQKLTDVNIASSSRPVDENDNFFTKIKGWLTKQDDHTLDLHEKLLRFGVLEELAETYIKDVANGVTIVITDDELKMGHA